jgi:hypothetical protein
MKVFGCCYVVNGGLDVWVMKKMKGGARVGWEEEEEVNFFFEFLGD